MEAKSLLGILRMLNRKYDINPREWHMLIEDKLSNIYITGPNGCWKIKVDSFYGYNPNPVAIVTRIEDEDIPYGFHARHKGSPHYGFRPVPRKMMERLIEEIEETDQPPYETLKKILKTVMATEPVPSRSLRGTIMHGPIMHAPRLEDISDAQRKLEFNMSSEMEKLTGKKYYYIG